MALQNRPVAKWKSPLPRPDEETKQYNVTWYVGNAAGATETNPAPANGDRAGLQWSSTYVAVAPNPDLQEGDLVYFEVQRELTNGKKSIFVRSPVLRIRDLPAVAAAGGVRILADAGLQALWPLATWTKSPTAGVVGYGIKWYVNGAEVGNVTMSVTRDADSDVSGYSVSYDTNNARPSLSNSDMIQAGIYAYDGSNNNSAELRTDVVRAKPLLIHGPTDITLESGA